MQSDSCMTFSERLLAWSSLYGRTDLPWQQQHPYIVWLSEVMLQQTQVKTVIPYFHKFFTRFPTVHDLATAEWDEVAQLWAGLGYYARARNLHKTAKLLSHHLSTFNDFPDTLEQWVALPGIGQSTAGAIMAMGCGKYGVILDGNVKRVLTRYLGITDDITKSATTKLLWEKAKALTPNDKSGQYSQAIMDLGATICTRNKPLCHDCPFFKDCYAYKTDTINNIPYKPKKKTKPQKNSFALFIHFQNKTLWLQRPAEGIWGGLWSVPLSDMDPSQKDNQTSVYNQIYSVFKTLNIPLFLPSKPSNSIKHTLTHFHWWLHFLQIKLAESDFHCLNDYLLQQQDIPHKWLIPEEFEAIAKPKAMEKLLTQFGDISGCN